MSRAEIKARGLQNDSDAEEDMEAEDAKDDSPHKQ